MYSDSREVFLLESSEAFPAAQSAHKSSSIMEMERLQVVRQNKEQGFSAKTADAKDADI
jgi:hypothetical protein